MRYTDFISGPLLERTLDNQQVAEAITGLIIDGMPSRFPADETITQHIGEASGYRALLRAYAGSPYEKAVAALQHHRIFWVNRTVFDHVGGAYVSAPHFCFEFRISSFLQKAGDFTKQEVLSFRLSANPIKTFRALVLHEVRHLLQAYSYSSFFHSGERKTNFTYSTSPVEIDAAWAHNLEDHPYTQYETAAEFVNTVMTSLAGYKTLTPAQVKHYRAKTAAYWMARKSGKDDKYAMSLGDRLAARRKEFSTVILNRLNAMGSSDVDLRKLPGYSPDASRFLFPNSIFRNVAGGISKGRIKSDVAPIVYLAIALAGVGDDAAMIGNYLRTTAGITVDDAMAHSEAAFRGGFDIEALRNVIRQTFGQA